MRLIKALVSIAGFGSSPPRPSLVERFRRWRKDLLWKLDRKRELRRVRRREPALFNAALKRPAWQSSTRNESRYFVAARGTNGQIGARTCFATSRERSPWWMVELKADWPIYAIHLHKRYNSQGRRTTRLEVSLSADQQQWDVVYSGQFHFGDAASPGPLVIRLLDSRSARFVRVALPEGGELALNQVEVMVKKRHRDLLRASRRYGFIFEKMTAMRTPSHVKPYTVENAPPKFSGELSAFYVIKAHGRFGNNLLQIGTAALLARDLGIRRIYLMKFPLLEIQEPIRFGDVTVYPDALLEQHKPVGLLSGTFFHREQFGGAAPLSFDRILEATRTLGEPIFYGSALQPGLAVKPTDLVIHLRAGDIFARPQPHPNYIQPPLAFYKLCVEFARTELGTDRVILVYEDEGNPCIPALRSWLDEIGVECITHSRSLAEDIAILLAATHCVFGHGTFGLLIALLSRHMKTVLYTWLETRFEDVCELTGIRGIVAVDRGSGYIRNGEWRNAPEQRQLMLDYPIENLQLKAEDTGAASRRAS